MGLFHYKPYTVFISNKYERHNVIRLSLNDPSTALNDPSTAL